MLYEKASIFLPLLIFLVFLIPAGCDGGLGLTPEEHVARANDYYDQKELRAAIIELKNALQEAPDNLKARWLLGLIYLDIGDGASAEKELRRAVELGMAAQAAAVPLAWALLKQKKFEALVATQPDVSGMPKEDSAELWAIYGDAYFILGQKDAADLAYNKALSLQGDSPGGVTGKARLSASEGEIDQARLLLGQVQKAHPDFKQAWSLLGDIERAEGNAQGAEAAYSKAIEPQAIGDMNLLNRSLMRIQLGDEAGADSDISKLKKQVPDNPMVAYAEGLLEYHRKNYAEAQQKFEVAVSGLPDSSPAVYYLAVTHYMQNNLQQAEMYGQRFLTAYPGYEPVRKLLGATRLQLGDFEGAKSALLPVLARNSKDTDALKLLAEVELRNGKTQKSTEYLQKLISELPDSADAYMKMGVSYMMEDSSQQGVAAFEEAIRLDPQAQEADIYLILAYLRAKKLDEALMAAEQFRDKYPDNPKSYNLIASVFLARNDVAAARESFATALTKDPGNPVASNYLANLEIQSGDLEKARTLYEGVLKHRPGNLSSLLALARIDKRQGRISAAIAHLEYAIEENPTALQPRVQLGTMYLHTGKPSRVLGLMREIPEAYSTHPSVLGLVGEAQLALQEQDNAAITFKKLVDQVPGSARAHYLLAKAYAELGRSSAVRTELEKALELKPDFMPAKVAMTRLLMENNQPEAANQLLQELVKAYPGHPEVTTLKGWLAMRQGRLAEAIAAYQETLKQQPSQEVTLYLAASLGQQGDQEGTIAVLKEWLSTHPEDIVVQFNLANAYLLQGRNDLAREAFSRVVELAPNHAMALNNLAWLLRKEDPSAALKYAERAYGLTPESPNVMDTLGALLLKQGQPQRALGLLRTASEKMPGNLDTRYQLALALVRNGDTSEARKILNQILGQDQPFERRKDAEALLQSIEG